jgi:NADPH:quinone reductase-like Zn-dependent oxidoreductase
MADSRIIISGLWVAVMLTFLLGDVLRIFAGDQTPGELMGKQATPGMWLGIAVIVIDYTQEDFASGRQVDLIFDIAGNRSLSEYLRALRPKGTYVACAISPVALLLGPVISMLGSKRVVQLSHSPNAKDLAFMKELIEAGKVAPVIARVYPLSEAAEALRNYEDGHAQGKVVIAVAPGDKT